MYTHRGVVTDQVVGGLLARLARTGAWGKLRKARVFTPATGVYTKSPRRDSFKATLHDNDLVCIIRDGLPPEVHIPCDRHVDLLRYTQGQHFDRHTDFVNTHPHHARQVTVLVGLRCARAGGTILHTEGGHKVTCEETIRRGGLLIFDSALPHAGGAVDGVKEVLSFVGFHFPPQRARAPLRGAFTTPLSCLAVHQEVVHLWADNSAPEDATRSHGPLPWVHVYTSGGGRRLASCNMETNLCVRYTHQPPVRDANTEQLVRMQSPYTDDAQLPYPLLREALRRKRVCAMASTACRTRCKSRVLYTEDREYCNAGDDYDTTHVPTLRIHTSCARFRVAMYDRRYVAYWVGRVSPIPLVPDVVERICEYAEW